LTIPNFITLGRVFLVPVIFWLLVSGRVQAAFWTFVVAGISDGVDGYLAKRFDWASELGAYLDPLADKLLVVSIFIAMGVRGELPSWLVIAVVSRDVLIVIAIILAWLFSVPVRIKPFAISKANTLAQLLLASTVLADVGFGLGLTNLRWWLIWITAALTFASLAAYMYAWLQLMAGAEAAITQAAAPTAVVHPAPVHPAPVHPASVPVAIAPLCTAQHASVPIGQVGPLLEPQAPPVALGSVTQGSGAAPGTTAR
jgi:cardiolipin synthase (CMP-forming)